MKNRTWLTLGVLQFLVVGWLGAQTPSLAPDVLTGVLPDGLTYFVQKNPKPVHRVQLSLIVRAGSVQERPDQRGLAHLLEHMEFQGTDHFGPQAIVSFLETNGMKFGADLNANTGFTATQYFLALPTDKPESFQTGLRILEDWARGPQINQAAFENEKKVVLEEGRLRMNNVRGRVTNFVVPAFYAGSPYADRLPIGSMDIVKNATPDQVLEFSHTWYRPENMAVVIVGDIDPQDVKAQLLAQFTGPIRPNTSPVVEAPLPPDSGRVAQGFQDPEMATSQIEWTTVEPAPLSSPEAWEHFQLLDRLLSRVLGTRFSELSRAAQPPFQDAAVYGRLAFGSTWERSFVVQPYDGRVTEGVEAFVQELERVRTHGVTNTDFALAVSELKSQIETSYAQRRAITNEDRSGTLAEYFLRGVPVPGDEATHRIDLDQLAGITPAELKAFAETALGYRDFRLVVLSPEKPGVSAPAPQAVLDTIARVQSSKVAAAEERQVVPLLAKVPTPGVIARTETLAGLGITIYHLANGAQVLAKKTDFSPNQVQVKGQRLGGLSLVEDQDVLSVSQASSVFGQTGLGRLNATQLGDFLSGKQVQVEVELGPNSVVLDGESTKADLETLFQMLHEQLGPPHRDPDAEAAWRNQKRDALANSQNLPATLADNEIQRVLTNGNPRSLPLTVDRLAKVDLDRAAQVYGDLLSNPQGLVLAVVGDFDPDQMKTLVATYIASLASGPRSTVVDRGIRPVPGPVRSVLALGSDNKAENSLFMINPRPFHPDDRFAANVLREALDIRLRDVLRNANGGTYDVGSGVALSPLPYPQATVEVDFTCDPARQAELATKALGVLDSVAAGDWDDATFEKAKAIEVRQVEGYLNQNDFWSGILPEYTLKGYDLGQLTELKALYEAVTREQVVQLAQEILTTKTALQVVLEPQK